MQPEVLEYLQANRTGFDVLFELLCCALTEARTNIAEVDIGEEHHAIRIGTVFDYRKPAPQIFAPAPAEVNDEPDVELVHRLHNLFVLLRRDRRAVMAVNVDHRKLGARHRMLWHDQCGARLILTNVGRRPLWLASFGRTRTDLARRLRRLRVKRQAEAKAEHAKQKPAVDDTTRNRDHFSFRLHEFKLARALALWPVRGALDRQTAAHASPRSTKPSL